MIPFAEGQLVGMVKGKVHGWVRSWVIHYADEGPHKDRSTMVCVCVLCSFDS